MTVKASAGSTLLLAAGLFAAFAGPLPATAASRDTAATAKSENATSGKSVRHGSRYLKKRYAHRKYARVAAKSAETRKAAETQTAEASGRSPISESVANANAQMISADAAPDNAKAMSEAMSAKVNTILSAADQPADALAPADAAVVAADRLNSVDRALQEMPSTQAVAMAQLIPAQEAPVLASNTDSSMDRSSLIGKIFIAFGALLTMASAARMFMV